MCCSIRKQVWVWKHVCASGWHRYLLIVACSDHHFIRIGHHRDPSLHPSCHPCHHARTMPRQACGGEQTRPLWELCTQWWAQQSPELDAPTGVCRPCGKLCGFRPVLRRLCTCNRCCQDVSEVSGGRVWWLRHGGAWFGWHNVVQPSVPERPQFWVLYYTFLLLLLFISFAKLLNGSKTQVYSPIMGTSNSTHFWLFDEIANLARNFWIMKIVVSSVKIGVEKSYKRSKWGFFFCKWSHKTPNCINYRT